MPLEARRRQGILMHPVDILNFYREHYLNPVDASEQFRLQLNLQETVKVNDALGEQRKAARRIRHDMLEAEKRRKALEFAQIIKVAVKEEKAKEEEIKPEVEAPMIVATSKRRKKKTPIY